MRFLSTLLLLVCCSVASAQDMDRLELNDYDPAIGQFFVQGQEARLRFVSQHKVTVKAIFRPNTEVAVEQALSSSADGWINSPVLAWSS